MQGDIFFSNLANPPALALEVLWEVLCQPAPALYSQPAQASSSRPRCRCCSWCWWSGGRRARWCGSDHHQGGTERLNGALKEKSQWKQAWFFHPSFFSVEQPRFRPTLMGQWSTADSPPPAQHTERGRGKKENILGIQVLGLAELGAIKVLSVFEKLMLDFPQTFLLRKWEKKEKSLPLPFHHPPSPWERVCLPRSHSQIPGVKRTLTNLLLVLKVSALCTLSLLHTHV